MKTQTRSLFAFHELTVVSEGLQDYISIPEFKMELQFKHRGKKSYIIQTSEDLANLSRKIIGEGVINWYESMIVIALSRQNKVINYYRISQGGITGTVADTRMVLQFALACNATSIVLVHNHPSGNLQPSRADEEVTHKTKLAGELHDIKLIDHIIVTEESFYSFNNAGTL